jgi:hypothetical protein
VTSFHQKKLATNQHPSTESSAEVTKVSIGVFAGELVRLAETVKQNVDTRQPPIQTISQLNAMEPIIAFLRAAGLKLLLKNAESEDKSCPPGYL